MIGNIPNTFEELIKLPGVGRKVANLYLSVAHNKDVIAVGFHVHRISNRIGWVESSTALETEKQLIMCLKNIGGALIGY